MKMAKTNIPATCGECDYFKDALTDFGKKHGFTFCKLSDQPTYRFQNPVDRPVPRPSKCPYNPI